MDGINPILRDAPFGDGSPDRRGARAFRAMRDTVFAVTIGLTGLAVLSPLSGLAAARETLKRNRERRRREDAVLAAHGEVWLRQTRRNMTTKAMSSAELIALFGLV